jgi:hypothetical protein
MGTAFAPVTRIAPIKMPPSGADVGVGRLAESLSTMMREGGGASLCGFAPRWIIAVLL